MSVVYRGKPARRWLACQLVSFGLKYHLRDTKCQGLDLSETDHDDIGWLRTREHWNAVP